MNWLDHNFGFNISLPGDLSGDEKEKVLTNLRWVLGNFQGNIAEMYTEGAPRREQACNMVENYMTSIRPSLSENEWYILSKSVVDFETGKSVMRHGNFKA